MVVVNKVISSNWKSLAPHIKSGQKLEKKNEEQKPPGEMWFDVDEQTLRRSQLEIQRATTKTIEGDRTVRNTTSVIELFPKKENNDANNAAMGKYLAMDCEMVGVGPDGKESALARVSLVNWHGEAILDQHVMPTEPITDYRTAVSGVEPHHLVGAPSLAEVQRQVWDLLQGRILVGHSLRNDFRVLLLEHPKRMTRDTSKYRPFRRLTRGKSPSLKRLAQHFLGISIQEAAHDSLDDARVTMLLYRSHKDQWENYLFRGEGRGAKARSREIKRSKTDKAA